ncbi:MAG: M23 family metallopeptidase [Armatimonadetes bacterium]|nr:M23 family metallopeptidase [Armatimonadota bacterium]
MIFCLFPPTLEASTRSQGKGRASYEMLYTGAERLGDDAWQLTEEEVVEPSRPIVWVPLPRQNSFMRPTGGLLTSRYGYRWGRLHRGVDLASRSGTMIRASRGGVVSYSGWMSGYGNLVEINHKDGYSTRYAHNSANLVRKGDLVRAGQPIARVGSTGRSTAPHVHFEVLKNGRSLNPQSCLK